MDRLLVLVRHGQSDWNLKNLFTGWKDPDLTPKGIEEAREGGRKLKALGLSFDCAFTSALIRAQNTLKLMLHEIGQPNLPTTADEALNERDYGDLSGLNKDDARKKWGEEQVHLWRRSYDVSPPGGESLFRSAEQLRALGLGLGSRTGLSLSGHASADASGLADFSARSPCRLDRHRRLSA